MTPVEFQIYSGCTSADWKTGIKIYMSDCGDEEKFISNKKSNLKSIKDLVEEKILKLSTSNVNENISKKFEVSKKEICLFWSLGFDRHSHIQF